MRNIKLYMLICVIFLFGVLLGVYTKALTISRIQSLYSQCSSYASRQRIICLQSSFSPYVRSPEVIRELMHAVETINLNQQDSAMPLSLTCHDLGHIVGELAGRSNTSLAVLVSACGRSCEFGCVHGVITGRIRANPSLLDQVSVLCEEQSGENLTQIQQIACHHGLGHVFAELAGYQVNDSLVRCAKLLGGDAKRDCASGVFMEIFRPPMMSHTPTALPVDVIEYCNRIPTEFVFKCIYDGAMVTYTANKSIQKGMRVCRELPDFEKAECEKAVGGAVYAEVQADPKRVAEVCHEASDQELPCLQGAIVQPLVIDPTGKLSLDICRASGERFFAQCEREVKIMKSHFDSQ